VSCVPEFFADTPVINGMAYPQLTLPAGVHRFRMLNGTQSRVWNLQLYKESVANPGDPDLGERGPDFIQLGTDGGFLPKPAVVPSGNQFNLAKYSTHDTSGYGLVLAGAERADVLINFSACAGQSFILYNDAPSPFPEGTEADYFTGNGAPDSGHGPNTRTLMRITITDAAGGQKTTDAALLAALDAEPGTPVALSGLPGPGPRLQDVLDPAAPLAVTLHDTFDFWAPERGDDPQVAALLEQANASIIPTTRLASVPAAYVAEMGERRYLRWVQPYAEDPLLDALARLRASRTDALAPGTTLLGTFRAHGLLVPVWELEAGVLVDDLEDPAVEMAARLATEVQVRDPLDADARRARAALANRQITLR
jgi:hypothetical protein